MDETVRQTGKCRIDDIDSAQLRLVCMRHLPRLSRLTKRSRKDSDHRQYAEYRTNLRAACPARSCATSRDKAAVAHATACRAARTQSERSWDCWSSIACHTPGIEALDFVNQRTRAEGRLLEARSDGPSQAS